MSLGIKLAQCKESNAVASKLGAIIILRGVLGRPVSPDDIPDTGGASILETVVAASSVRVLGDVIVEPDTGEPAASVKPEIKLEDPVKQEHID